MDNFLSGLTNSYTATTYDRLNRDVNRTEKLKEKIENGNLSSDDELMEACKTFEGYFLQMMYKSMRATIDDSGSFLQRSSGERIFQDMLDDEYCKRAASGNNGVGLAQMLYKQLSRTNNKKI